MENFWPLIPAAPGADPCAEGAAGEAGVDGVEGEAGGSWEPSSPRTKTAEERSMSRHSTVPHVSLPTIIRTAFAGLKSCEVGLC